MRLIIATRNKSKYREIRKLLEDVKVPVVSLNQLGEKFRIVENEKTFLSNALKKAAVISRAYRDDYVIGEDSGLVVDYLKGSPGVKSKRYAGKDATYRKNNLKLISELKGVKGKNRKAYFCTYLALVKRSRLVKSFAGKLQGFISKEPQGKYGFGYDPVFYLPKYKKTVAELPLKEKNKISHRSKAFKKLKRFLSEEKEKYLTI